MKGTIVIDFKNIISELESKNLKLCFLKKNNGIFIEDTQGNLYVIEVYRYGSYLDQLIKDGTKVKFNLVDSHSVEYWRKEVWDVSEVKEFIKRHSLIFQ